jgi:hypothetical protein
MLCSGPVITSSRGFIILYCSPFGYWIHLEIQSGSRIEALCVPLCVAAALAANGSLLPFFRQMMWLRRNYSDVNVMSYGSIIGGYGAALGAATGMDRVAGSLAVFCIAFVRRISPLRIDPRFGWQSLRHK